MTQQKLLLRGALGGAAGGFLGAAVLWPFYKPHYGQGTESRWFVLFLLAYSPFAAAVGAAIGTMIWRVRVKTGRDINLFIRALLGASSAGVLGILVSLVLHTDADRAFSAVSYTMFYAKYGLFVGTIAGIFAATSKRKP